MHSLKQGSCGERLKERKACLDCGCLFSFGVDWGDVKCEV